MKKTIRYTLLWIVIFFQHTYVSGQDKVDSLRQLLSSNLVDTIRVDVLNTLSQVLYSSDGDSSSLLAERALELSHKIDYKLGEAYAHHNLAVNFSNRGIYDSATSHYEKSLLLKFELNDLSSAANTMNNIGIIHVYRSDLARALNYMQRSLKLKLENGDSLSASNNLNNIGIIHNRQKNYDLALEYHLKALEIRKAYNDLKKQSSSLSNIGLVSIEKENYSDALIYLRQSYDLLDSLQSTCRKTRTVLNIGLCHLSLNKLDSAAKYIDQAKELAIACSNPYDQAIAYLNSGSLHKKQGFIKKAEADFLKSYRIATEHDLKLNAKKSSKALYEFYKTNDKPIKALKYLEISTELKDSLSNEDLTEQLTTMELNYQFEQERDSLEHQKKTELLVLNTEVREQRLYKNIMIIAVIILLLVVYLIFRNYKTKKLVNLYLQKRNKIQQEKLEIEEKARKQLELDNNQKARALTASSIQMLNLNEKMDEIVKNIDGNDNIEVYERKKVIKEIKKLRSGDSQWDNIKIHFENVHPYFFERLDKYYPQLSTNDQKILAFLKMKLSNQEIALILNVTKKTVEQSKRRLKKKLGIDSADIDVLRFVENESTLIEGEYRTDINV